MGKKLKVGWFSFSCCEDSTIIFTEILNDYYKEWKKKIDFKSALVLQKKSEIKDLDVAFVEGAIASEKQEKQLKEIRNNCKMLVAIGACACIGLPSAQRNNFDETTQDEIRPILLKFAYSDKVKKLSDVVKVDAQVPGCPMTEEGFINIVNEALKKFNIS